MTAAPRVSIVIRTLNEAADLGGVLDRLAAQTVGGDDVETIVVDSGSSDGTVAIAQGHGARVIEIAPESFTYGGALNLGAAAAAAPIVVALSGHAYPRDDGWLARVLRHFDDDRVACASGSGVRPDGEPLTQAMMQDVELARRFPFWGYSNSAGGFRADLWRERPFREDMPYTEDKEWAWYWLQRGHVAVIDPAIETDHSHSRDPPRDCYRRARLAWRGFGMYTEVPRMSIGELAAEWSASPTFKSRFHPSVLAALLGQYVERRATRP